MKELRDEIFRAASKEALVRVLKQHFMMDSLIFDLIIEEWHVRNERALAAMNAANEELQGHSGGKTIEEHIAWLKAHKRFSAATKAIDAAWAWHELQHKKLEAERARRAKR